MSIELVRGMKMRMCNAYLQFFSLKNKGIFIAKGSHISVSKLLIGMGTRINGPIKIKGTAALHIGNYCAFGDGIRIITSNHSMKYLNLQYLLQKKITGSFHSGHQGKGVVIGHDVWIGDASIILPNVTIGNGAVIAAGAIVTKDVKPYTVVAGIPAIKKSQRFPDNIVSLLQEAQWWNLDESNLRREYTSMFSESYDESPTHFEKMLRDMITRRKHEQQ